MRVEGLRTYWPTLPGKTDKGVVLPSEPMVATEVPATNVNRKNTTD
jgi:hypothetical protein